MIDSHLREEILARIKMAEHTHGVRVLYAIESGSRAWGFASPNSDYDVRFVYAHPRDWYLQIDVDKARDVIEYPIVDDIDINGWDIRKALQLACRSNPSIFEWLQSPIVYLDTGGFADAARALTPGIYSPVKGYHHYASMAHHQWRARHSGEHITLKKYLYVLRALLCMHWLQDHSQPPPVEFAKLRPYLAQEPAIDALVESLLQQKQRSLEKDTLQPLALLDNYIQTQLNTLQAPSALRTEPLAMAPINQLFRQCLV
jgi:uncharacterized protein